MTSRTKLSKHPKLRMSAEWEPHEATWIAWPHNESDWPGKFACIPHIYAEIVRHLARAEKVHIIVNDASSEKRARKVLQECGALTSSVRFHHWPTDRVWTRDSGPIFVRNGKKLATTNWHFNGWAKYRNHKNDDLLPDHIGDLLQVQEFVPAIIKGKKIHRVVLEGGSIDVNGRGTMLTTEECLLSSKQQRNRGLDKKDLEQIFAKYLGVNHVIWLGRGIEGDDTHGHVDDISRFVGAHTVLTAVEPSRRDKNHSPLKENFKRLRGATDQDGKRLEVIEIPMPSPVYHKGQRLPASYANFYIANGVVLVPIFGDANDRVALDIIAQVFPTRTIVPIYCRDFIWGLGAIHCMTQQQPAI
jgi:agmatine deiminase